VIVYKIYNYPKFEEVHSDYFIKLLDTVEKLNVLSKTIDEIIITDDLDGEIERYSTNRFRQPKLTRTREYKAVSKTVDFNGKKKVFFDATYVNGYVQYTPQVFFEQLIEVHAEDIVTANYNAPQTFTSETAFTEVIKAFFSQWATRVVADASTRLLSISQEHQHKDVKMFVDSFKRNIRRLHYQYQVDQKLGDFWISVVMDVDQFVRRCQDVKFDNGSFEALQEFKNIIPPLLTEIELQTQNILKKDNIDISLIRNYTLDILRNCFIDIPSEKPMNIKIMETPKKLFRGNLVDTEPRVVAFIDILGFSAIIEEYDADKTSNLLNELHDTLETAIKIAIEGIHDSKAKSDLSEFLEYRMFSDCICLSLPYIEFGNDFHIQFHSLAMITKSYQLAMMQKGFFVRGGIAIGSFYADKNMIFSGGLVSAYKLEQVTSHPVIAVDKTVIERLRLNYLENSKGLFYENMLIYSQQEAGKVFLNPFDLLDNSVKYFDYLQSTVDNLVNEEELNDDDPISQMTKSLLLMASSFTKPIFESAKSQMTPENLNLSKEEILKHINEELDKYNSRLSMIQKKHVFSLLRLLRIGKEDKKVTDIKKVILKYEYLKRLTEWSLGKIESTAFKYYSFRPSKV
jgi:hypothetical protein